MDLIPKQEQIVDVLQDRMLKAAGQAASPVKELSISLAVNMDKLERLRSNGGLLAALQHIRQGVENPSNYAADAIARYLD